jgi:ribonuclease Z
MRPSFYPQLVNGPFEDPALYIPFIYENRAILFDLGDLHALSPRELLKISHVFVTHTHMDHFVGFDRLLRLLLGRTKTLCLYGPRGFIRHVESKLAGYAWNLVENYTNRFVLNVTEVRRDRRLTRCYACRNKFRPQEDIASAPFDGTLLEESALKVSAVILNHQLPCLGFSIEERFHVNILKDRLAPLGLNVGPWLRRFKQALFSRHDPDTVFEIMPSGPGGGERRSFVLKDLAGQIAMISPGQKVAYIADVLYDRDNEEKIVALIDKADQLFIEAAFLEEQRETAREKYHLTARQAGTLAGRAHVRQFTIFHFSPRYSDRPEQLRLEADAAFVLAGRPASDM